MEQGHLLDFKECRVSFYEFVVQGFLVDSFSQGEELICGFWMFWKICSQLSLCILSVLRLILTLTVCPVRAFMTASISNIKEHIEIPFFFVTDDVRNKEVSRISINAECLSSQAFNSRKQLI